METKDLLIELCGNLEKELNAREITPIHKVEFISGLNPENYFLPQIHIGTTKTIREGVRMCWFVEIWVDRKCIFRESWIPSKTESLEVEAVCITRTLRNVFNFGVMQSKKYIEETLGK